MADFTDLGQTYDGPTDVGSKKLDKAPKISYPTLYITSDGDMDFPEEGTALVKFRRVSETKTTRDAEDPRYNCELEIMGIRVEDESNEDDEDEKPEDPVDALERSLKGEDDEE